MLVVTVTLIAASYLLLVMLERSLTDSRDEVAQALARELARDAETGTLTTPIAVGDDTMAQVVSRDGTVLAASTSLGGHGPVTDLTAGSAPELQVLSGVPDDTDVETYRVWALAADSASGPVRVYVGTSPERVDEAVRVVRNALLIGLPLLLLLLTAVTYALAGRALRPVEEAHRRQREFVGDASHELLSPLASLRTQLEVAAATPETTRWTELVDDLREETGQMERLVNNLLFLAREDDGAGPPPPTMLLDLDTLVLEEVRRLRLGPGLVVDTEAVSAAPVRGRPDELSRMVRNVLENAAEHAASQVTVALTQAGDRVELTVADDGPGVPEDLRDRVFERFVRVEPHRARSRGGAGLGLPIALAIARRHGGTIELAEVEQGTTLRIILAADLPG
jgi:signal transduction histidine kinase